MELGKGVSQPIAVLEAAECPLCAIADICELSAGPSLSQRKSPALRGLSAGLLEMTKG